MKNYEINIRGNAEYCGETWNMYLKKHHVCFCLQQRVNYDLPDLQLMVLLQFKRKWLTWVYYLGGTWSLLVSFFFLTWPGLRSLFFAQHEGYGNAWRERFDPVRKKLAKTNWIYLELSLRKSLLLNLFVFTVSCCYLLFIHFTFLKNQYTIVENKGALDVISKTLR